MKAITIVLITLILGVTVFLTTTIVLNNAEKNTAKMQEKIWEDIYFETEVYNYIKSLNISHPEIVLIQAKVESGNFQSKLFIQHNNIFGMKLATKRPTTAIGKTSSGYAIFNNWKESVIDYALYQTYSAKNLSQDDYIQFLNKYYAEDSLYDIKIKNSLKKK